MAAVARIEDLVQRQAVKWNRDRQKLIDRLTKTGTNEWERLEPKASVTQAKERGERYRGLSLSYAEKPDYKPLKQKKTHKAYFKSQQFAEKLQQFAQEHRDQPTDAEIKLNVLLGEALKRKGVQFSFQYPIDRYILDFYIPAHSLAIEVDGFYHYTREQWAKDLIRTNHLHNRHGIAVMRFDNDEVEANGKIVLRKIFNFCQL